jgi:hypothetical protein
LPVLTGAPEIKIFAPRRASFEDGLAMDNVCSNHG